MQPMTRGSVMDRTHDIARLYDELAAFARRARWLSAGLHPGLSLVAYTLLSHAAGEPDVRAADLAERYALDKSTVSRQIALLERQGLLRRSGERPGRRGHVLEVTAAGHQLLDAAATSLQQRLADRLDSWPDKDIALLAELLARFNATTG
jgi:DNA-binding MarR family transcriptional regulator